MSRAANGPALVAVITAFMAGTLSLGGHPLPGIGLGVAAVAFGTVAVAWGVTPP